MYNFISISTQDMRGDIETFKFEYRQDIDSRNLEIVFAESENNLVVFLDEDLPLGKTYEIRADGVWSDINEEIKDGHWSFSLESFALRMDHQDFFSTKGELIGERIPFGYELDLVKEGKGWFLSGEIFIAKDTIDFPNSITHFEKRSVL